MAEGDITVLGSGIAKMMTGDLDINGGNAKMALLLAHTIDRAFDFFDDVSADEISDASYTDGGEALTATVSSIAANSWGSAWQASQAYVVGDIVRPSTGNGFVYKAIAGGTSAGGEPTWPTTIGTTVVDNGVTWLCAGVYVVALDFSNAVFTALDAGTPSHGIIYLDEVSDATSPLLCYVELGTASNGGDYTVQVGANGMIFIIIP